MRPDRRLSRPVPSDTRSAAVTSMRAVASRPLGLTSQTNVSVSLTQYATTVERRRAAVAAIWEKVAGDAPRRAAALASSVLCRLASRSRNARARARSAVSIASRVRPCACKREMLEANTHWYR